MKKGKDGERFFVNLERIKEDHEEDFDTNSHVLRDKYLTGHAITGRSLKELAKKDNI